MPTALELITVTSYYEGTGLSPVRKPPFVAKVAKEMQQKLITSNLGIGSSYILRITMFSLLEVEMETIDLQLTDEEFCALAKEAHRLDITFNQYIEKILREAMKEHTGG